MLWIFIGLLGQACLAARFLLQWLASERERRSVVPWSFWYLSLCGGMAILVYAVHRKDPVIVLGQIAGLGVYSRNLFLTRRRSDVEGSLSG